MAVLTTASRKTLPSSQFAGPNRSYPIPDRAHAANAKARATQQENAGRLSAGQAARIRAKADRKLNDFHGNMADHHLALHAHHTALADHFADNKMKEVGILHHGIAQHHLTMANHHHDMHEQYKSMADEEGTPAEESADRKAGMNEGSKADQSHDAMAIGAAEQLHRKGHITSEHRDRIRATASAKLKKPFGSLSGAMNR